MAVSAKELDAMVRTMANARQKKPALERFPMISVLQKKSVPIPIDNIMDKILFHTMSLINQIFST